MGGDFISASMPLFELTPQRKESLAWVLARYPDRDMREWVEDYGVDVPGWDDDGLPSKNASYARDFLLRAVEEALARKDYRDTSCIWCDGSEPYRALITGGMSWGDSPTESYDYFWTVQSFYLLWDKCRKYAMQDYAREKEAKKRDQAEAEEVAAGGPGEYTVTIEEVIEERREYRVFAKSFEDAAEQVASMWINNGVEPEDGPDVEVTERSYIVKLGDEQEVFDLSEVEES